MARIGRNIDIIAACYRPEETRETIRFLGRTAKALARRDIQAARTVLVCNSQESREVARTLRDRIPGLRVHLLRGTNVDGEWSAWDEGLQFSGLDAQPGGVLFLNDTAVTHRIFSIFMFRALIRSLERSLASPSPQPLGFVSWPRSPVREDFGVKGHKLGRWLTTYLYFLPRRAMADLGGQVRCFQKDIRSWRPGEGEDRFFPEWLDGGLRRHLTGWLFQGGWYGSRAPDTSRELLELKARCILYEKCLSAYLSGELGYDLVDPFDHQKILLKWEDFFLPTRYQRLLEYSRFADPARAAGIGILPHFLGLAGHALMDRLPGLRAGAGPAGADRSPGPGAPESGRAGHSWTGPGTDPSSGIKNP